MEEEEISQIDREAERLAKLEALQPITFVELEKKVRQWILIADPGIIKFLCAMYIANHLEGRDPVWVFLIGPSGGGKTEFLNAMSDLADIYPLSLLTPQTFLSGMPGTKNASLLPKINNKIMMFKDWTNILSQNKDARNEIMGQLREIYDGHLKKPFGTGKVMEWKGKVGLIAGTTPAVDMAQQMHATLGERFIHYRILMPERKEVARRSLDNGEELEKMREELRHAFYAYFKGMDFQTPTPQLGLEAREELIKVANFVTLARSGVIREFSWKREVMFVPAAEMPTRITQQLNTIAHALAKMSGGESLGPEDTRIIYKLALDSIPQTNRMVMSEMARADNQSTAEIARSLGYPTPPIRMYLENLTLLGVCQRHAGRDTEQGGSADRWVMNSEYAEIVRSYEGIVPAEAQIQTALEVFPEAEAEDELPEMPF